MGGHEVTKTSIEMQKNDSDERPNMIGPAFHSFFMHLREKFQKCLKSHLKKSTNDDDGTHSANSITKDKESSRVLEVNLEKQLQAWRENPIWADQSPDVKVTVPKGSLCNLNVKVNVGLPPDAVYDIVTDPDNKRVFKNIKEVISRKVVVDDGPRQVVELEQAALWRFLWWSGTISVHVLVDQNREDYTMKFKQVRTGFMKRFEGCWRMEPIFVDEKSCHPSKPETLPEYFSCTKGNGRIGTKLSLEQLIQPSIVPPPPISWYLRGITTKTTEMLINDLLAETARLRGYSSAKDSKGELESFKDKSDERDVGGFCDIKERWALRRRKNTMQRQRKLPSIVKQYGTNR